SADTYVAYSAAFLVIQLDARERLGARAIGGAQLHPAQLPRLRLARARVAADQRQQLVVRDLTRLVGDLLELGEDRVQRVLVQLIAQRLGALGDGVLAAVLAQNQARRRLADILGVHDLVRAAVRQHAVLVDARLVREG